MKVGDVVKAKNEDIYGTVQFSTFGYSIHYWNEEHNALAKTLGHSTNKILEHWQICDMPSNYYIGEYGEVRKSI